MPGGHELTPRELEILHGLVAGHSDKRIATELGIARRTVSQHVSSILVKLNVANRTEAVAKALRTGSV